MFVPLALVICALVAGTALIAIECFIPGIGIAGITGGALSIFGVIALIPYIGWYVVFVVMAMIVIVLTCIYFFARSADSGNNPFVLSAKTDKEAGFSANEDNTALIGKCGETVTQLRPAGIALIDGKRVDVVTDGEYLEKGISVKVSDIQGRRIIVEKI